jgi:NAD(P)-dependent dehydrogenase (short-subunit alcohol dehydrogenase family)
MDKKIILITGSTDGIGKATAKTLAKQGHTVIIHGRNKEKTEKTYLEIKSETGNNNIDYVIADLLLLSDVKQMAQDIKQKYAYLDVLINNAGAMFGKAREKTKENLEKTIVLNLLSPFLLTKLLLDVLIKSNSARIINISSEMHRFGGKPDFNDFQLEKSYKPDRAYGLSKLYLIWITRHLAHIFKEKNIENIKVNVSHPGIVSTNFGKDSEKGILIDIVNFIFKISVMTSPEKGSITSVYLATSPEVENITGKYFGNRKKQKKASDKYYSLENEKLVWDYCEQTTR